MGGKRNKKGRQGARNGPRNDVRVAYPELVKEHAVYERYYNELGVVDDDTRDEFWAAMRRELPNSFRFTGSKR
jgi:multisite-specific tRNA:(cytosine-C5)-methyltransferase